MSMYGESSRRPVLDCSVEPSRTKQSFKDECDVNVILQRAKSGAMITHINRKHPVYADVSSMTDFREALAHVAAVEEFFGKLPAKVREHFGNESASFLEYMNDAGRTVEDLKTLGLRIMDDDRFNDPVRPPQAAAPVQEPPATAPQAPSPEATS